MLSVYAGCSMMIIKLWFAVFQCVHATDSRCPRLLSQSTHCSSWLEGKATRVVPLYCNAYLPFRPILSDFRLLSCCLWLILILWFITFWYKRYTMYDVFKQLTITHPVAVYTMQSCIVCHTRALLRVTQIHISAVLNLQTVHCRTLVLEISQQPNNALFAKNYK